MKRKLDIAYEKHGVSKLPYNFFPTPFLSRLEPYLNDRDLSKMSRSSKRHMILCYLRVSKLLHWNIPKALIFACEETDYFPPDAFLQVQIAKTMLLSPIQKEESIDSCEVMPRAMEQYLTGRNKRVWPFSFEAYMRSVCFVDCRAIRSQGLPETYNFNTRLIASFILHGDIEAKIRLQLQLGNYESYLSYREKSYKTSYFNLALRSCTSLMSDPRFIIHEAFLAITTGYQIEDFVFDYLGTIQDEEVAFMSLEHKSVFDYLRDNDVLQLYWFSYELLTNPNRGLERCQRLMKLGCFTKEEFLRSLELAHGSFIADYIDSDDEDSIREYMDECDPDTILSQLDALIEYEDTRALTIQRLKKILLYMRSYVDADTFVELQGIASAIYL